MILFLNNYLQIYYKAALKLRREGKIIFDEADKMCDPLEFSSEQRLNPDNMPFGSFVVNLIDSLIAKDEKGYFTEPVDLIAVPDYLQVISNPMDLGTMKESAKNDYYTSLMELKTDFDTMIDNCLLYNDEETVIITDFRRIIMIIVLSLCLTLVSLNFFCRFTIKQQFA